MSHIRMKITLAGLVLVCAVAYLAIAGLREGSVYYMPVDDFVGNSEFQGQSVRLSGTVSKENLDRESELLVMRFDLLGQNEKVNVVYRGVVPDMFAAGGDVVVEGEIDGHGVFQAHTLLTKCASKYEAETSDSTGEKMPEQKPEEHSK